MSPAAGPRGDRSVGLVGLGVMGKEMAATLRRAGWLSSRPAGRRKRGRRPRPPVS